MNSATFDFDALASRFCSCPVPLGECADPCASMPTYPNRRGTNFLSVAGVKEMLKHILADLSPAPAAADWSQYEDEIADAITDSMDMDWTSRDGARAVVRVLNELGATFPADGPKGHAQTPAQSPGSPQTLQPGPHHE